MGLLDAIFGNNQPPKINSILPTAAKNEIRAGRLPILNTDSLFLKRGEKIHYIDKAINLEIKVVTLQKVIEIYISLGQSIRIFHLEIFSLIRITEMS